MKASKIFRRPMVLTGALTLATLGYKAFFNQFPGADENFFKWTGPTLETEDEQYGQWSLPVRYYRTDAFLGIFSASYEAVSAALPSPDLFPVRLTEDRANIIVAAYNYIECDAGPYGEILIGASCTYQREAPPVLPLLLETHFPNQGVFVLHLPVTSQLARDGGRKLYGFTKFMADMDFEKRPSHQKVRLEENGKHILTLTVRQRGITIKDNRKLATFSTLDHDLIKTTIPVRTIYQMDARPRSGSLELGDHAIADQLRELDISPSPIITRAFLSHAALLPPGEPVGKVSRLYAGHKGHDREYARLTVSYDDARSPVDVYSQLVEREPA
jgi:hypothetical protein